MSRWILDRLVGKTGLPLRHARVIRHGPPLEQFPFRKAPEPRRRLLYVGRVTEVKGVDVALDALRLMPEASLTLVGSVDPAYERAQRLPERVVLRKSVPRDSLHAVYAEHDVLLFPVTWQEPFGLVPLEAMAVGVPVVATGTGGSGEYLSHERNCLLVEAGDHAALAAAAERLQADRGLRERLIAEGRRTAERFSFERTSEQMNSAVIDLAAGRETSAGEAYEPAGD
jgi:glycosyltransferase involved in cell wall biosynthesis